MYPLNWQNSFQQKLLKYRGNVCCFDNLMHSPIIVVIVMTPRTTDVMTLTIKVLDKRPPGSGIRLELVMFAMECEVRLLSLL